MLHGVEVRRLDAVDHGVELHGLAQRGVCVAVYVAKKILVGKKARRRGSWRRARRHRSRRRARRELDAADHGAELFNPSKHKASCSI